MTASSRRREAGQQRTSLAPLLLLVAAIVLAALVYGCWRAGRWLQNITDPAPRNPFNVAAGIANGTVAWPLTSTILLVLVLLLVVLAAIAGGVAWTRNATLRDFDRAATFMPNPRELSSVTARPAKESAKRLLGPDAVRTPADFGLKLGTMAGPSKAPIWMHWEWVALVVGGPRCGKTAGLAIPMICQAPGPVVTTSNKSDLHNATRWVRSNAVPDGPAGEQIAAARKHRGRATPVRGRVWISDLQHIAGDDDQQWWWDPFEPIETLKDARELAAIFKGASTDSSARVDAYFDGGAQELLALYILAAAISGGDLQHVDGWLGDPELTLPADLLREHGVAAGAARIITTRELNGKQRDGLFDMARRFINVMSEPAYARSVLPPIRKIFPGDNTIGADDNRHDLPQFHPAEFVTSTDTMYAMSMEGAGAATSLTTALVDSIFKAAIAEARRCGGRLPVPMVAILDEAANVCRLPELPNWYSHFGSQGIVVVTFLQSLAQASKVWAGDSMDTLTGALNVFYYGGSSSNRTFLEWISSLIGTRDVLRRSRSNSSGGIGNTSVSESWSNEPILSVDKLAALPGNRAVVQTSGNRAILLRKEFYWQGPYRTEIAASRKVCSEAFDDAQSVTTLAPAPKTVVEV